MPVPPSARPPQLAVPDAAAASPKLGKLMADGRPLSAFGSAEGGQRSAAGFGVSFGGAPAPGLGGVAESSAVQKMVPRLLATWGMRGGNEFMRRISQVRTGCVVLTTKSIVSHFNGNTSSYFLSGVSGNDSACLLDILKLRGPRMVRNSVEMLCKRSAEEHAGAHARARRHARTGRRGGGRGLP